MLENNNIKFEKEVYYSDYIKGFNGKLRFDFVLNIGDENIFVEIFGITNNHNYNKKMNDKIQLCEQNGLKLLKYYPYDFWKKTQSEMFADFNKMKELIRQKESKQG